MVNTTEELDVISAALRAAGGPRVIVVTNKAHTRRVYILLEMLLWDITKTTTLPRICGANGGENYEFEAAKLVPSVVL